MSNQLVTRDSADLRLIIQSDKIREQLVSALPRAYSPDQFTVIVRTAINRNPKLMECDQASFLTAMLTAAQMGIAPDGRNGHLIPRWNKKTGKMEASFQPDYKGLVRLVRQNENVSDIYAEPVHERDTFRITKGLHRDLVHEVDIRADRGELIGAYAVIAYKDGSNSFEFMSKAEIEAIRKRSQSADFGPWSTDYSEMAKKTVIKRLLKLADLSPETHERMAHDPESTSITITSAAPSSPVSPMVPATPSLPEPAHLQLPSAEDPPAAKGEEPAPKRERKKAPKEPVQEPVQESSSQEDGLIPDMPTTGELTPLGLIRHKLTDMGRAESDLVKLCVAERWIRKGEGLDDLSAKAQESILEYWEEIKKALA